MLSSRLHQRDIDFLCKRLATDEAKDALWRQVYDPDDRVGYNALWIFSHLKASGYQWLAGHRNELIDYLFATAHAGKKRLALTLLEKIKFAKEDIRSDFIDYCFSKINSAEPYAIRALCLKLACYHCLLYPELKAELEAELDLMSSCELPPGLRCARRNVLRKMSRIN